MTMTNWEKAQLIVAALNEKGAGLGNGAWPVVAKALDTIDARGATAQEDIDLLESLRQYWDTGANPTNF